MKEGSETNKSAVLMVFSAVNDNLYEIECDIMFKFSKPFTAAV